MSGQVEFISEMQRWFYVRKFLSVMYYTSRLIEEKI